MTVGKPQCCDLNVVCHFKFMQELHYQSNVLVGSRGLKLNPSTESRDGVIGTGLGLDNVIRVEPCDLILLVR